MSEGEKQRLHAYIRGYVQGVGFRHHTMRSAGDLGLTGWVRNLRDGRVEVVAEGERSRLEELLAALRRGPISAEVEGIETEWTEASGEFVGFKVRRTV